MDHNQFLGMFHNWQPNYPKMLVATINQTYIISMLLKTIKAPTAHGLKSSRLFHNWMRKLIKLIVWF